MTDATLPPEGRAWLRALRLSALIAAHQSPGQSINESALHKVLADQERFAVGRRQVAEQMRHLGKIGLVYCDEATSGLVMTLTPDGADLVRGHGHHADVDSPSSATTRRLALAAAARLAVSTLGEPS